MTVTVVVVVVVVVVVMVVVVVVSSLMLQEDEADATSSCDDVYGRLADEMLAAEAEVNEPYLCMIYYPMHASI